MGAEFGESKVRFDAEYPLRILHKSMSLLLSQYYSFVKCNWCGYYESKNEHNKLEEDGMMIDGIPGFLVDEGVDTFRVIKAVGSCSAGIVVYKAELWGSRSIRETRDRFFAIKCVDTEKDPQKEVKLKLEVGKSRTLRLRDRSFGFSSSIIECHRQFYHDDRYYCCVFPYMEHGSLRGIMADRFPHGFPEQDYGILFLLYKTLQALDVFHRLGHAHGEVIAAHIFVHTTGFVKLGFSASLQDLLADKDRDNTSCYMPAASVCKWAAAPEVYNTSTTTTTKEADIWLLGITALELAYGGLRVFCRKDLDSLLIKIHLEKRLPKKLNENHHNNNKLSLPLCCLNRKSVFPLGFEQYWSSKKRVFSKGFVNLVLSCLQFEPSKRPTTDELLRCDVFKTVKCRDFLPTHLSC